MTQKEKLKYYIEKINSNEELKEEIYNKCDPCSFYQEEELKENLDWLLEGGCKHEYDMVPFMDDGSGGIYLLVNDEHVAYIDSEGCAGYIAESVEDFINILLVFRFFCYSKNSIKSFDAFMKEYNEDMFENQPSTIIESFLSDEHMDREFEMVYQKLVRGLTIFPAFVIEPTDDEYDTSENILRMDEKEFVNMCKNNKMI